MLARSPVRFCGVLIQPGRVGPIPAPRLQPYVRPIQRHPSKTGPHRRGAVPPVIGLLAQFFQVPHYVPLGEFAVHVVAPDQGRVLPGVVRFDQAPLERVHVRVVQQHRRVRVVVPRLAPVRLGDPRRADRVVAVPSPRHVVDVPRQDRSAGERAQVEVDRDRD
eukprot:CAMPEP_0183292304 /NCGR_PEP_ID=MMETSP0160_2-20130417/1404_1 /TAXON_ID=2839 ORGANISM="Odontella Sinensis, Strain Grunow 1884" /NCGR_SAMPLE_ID=MMETSP0160_2 /ASSEMBLY_ACC=CAM_ASM_000250 /LENGTH=162 /DNA_ID=CAMNT_0025453233 /DNA_START=95 /DNA_END=580 /DNA_ORIENTATION=+